MSILSIAPETISLSRITDVSWAKPEVSPFVLILSNIRSAGLEDWIEVHQGHAKEVANGWTASIDMLDLDGDQSPAGARAAYESWWPFLKPGGTIAIHNSSPREYDPTHDGHRRIVVEEILPPSYTDIRLVVHTTFARRSSD